MCLTNGIENINSILNYLLIKNKKPKINFQIKTNFSENENIFTFIQLFKRKRKG